MYRDFRELWSEIQDLMKYRELGQERPADKLKRMLTYILLASPGNP